jgi:hypothetical protein
MPQPIRALKNIQGVVESIGLEALLTVSLRELHAQLDEAGRILKSIHSLKLN